MKQVLILFLFLTGVASLTQYKYYLIQQSKTWSDAQTYCRATYTDLATIRSDADMVNLQAEAQIHQFSGDAWFGLYKESHDWRWSYRNESLGTFIIWGAGEPSNTKNKEECGAIYTPGTWWDVPCAWTLSFLCYDERNSGTSRYIHISNKKTFFEAQSYCRLYHTDLASSRDATENSLLRGMVSYWTWIGLHKVTWKWSYQTNPANITWKPGQPDNYLAFEDCGYLSNFQAADARCSNIKPFFCHEVLPNNKNQILRFKVQSDQNMNDPAAKAALLEKILQKLKEHGMEQNITLKWREQPGGDVFHKIKDADGVEIKRCQIKIF